MNLEEYLRTASCAVMIGRLTLPVGIRMIGGRSSAAAASCGLSIWTWASRIAGIPAESVVAGVTPYIGTLILCMPLITFVPEISTWLPHAPGYGARQRPAGLVPARGVHVYRHLQPTGETMRKLILLIMAALLCAGAWSEASAARVIKIAFTNFPEHPQGEAFALFKKEVEERSRGAFKVELIGSGKYDNPESIVQGLQMGVLHIGAESTSNFSVFAPRLMLFDMLYLIPSYEAANLVLDGPIGQELSKSLEKNGCLGMGFMELGFRQLFSIRPVASLEDNKGLKVRATPSKAHIAILRSLGMNPTPLAWGEVYTALQQMKRAAITPRLTT